MSSFTAPLEYEATGTIAPRTKLPQYRLLKSIVFYVGKKGSDFPITIPKGYVTDFASLPKFILRWFKPADDRWAKAALLHDYACSTHSYSRAMCDLIFLEAMLVLGTPWWIAQMFYRSVTLFSVYLSITGKRTYYVSE